MPSGKKWTKESLEAHIQFERSSQSLDRRWDAYKSIEEALFYGSDKAPHSESTVCPFVNRPDCCR